MHFSSLFSAGEMGNMRKNDGECIDENQISNSNNVNQ